MSNGKLWELLLHSTLFFVFDVLKLERRNQLLSRMYGKDSFRIRMKAGVIKLDGMPSQPCFQ